MRSHSQVSWIKSMLFAVADCRPWTLPVLDRLRRSTRVFEIGRIEALGEPAVDGREQVARLVPGGEASAAQHAAVVLL
jgi:hypothetical protein